MVWYRKCVLMAIPNIKFSHRLTIYPRIRRWINDTVYRRYLLTIFRAIGQRISIWLFVFILCCFRVSDILSVTKNVLIMLVLILVRRLWMNNGAYKSSAILYVLFGLTESCLYALQVLPLFLPVLTRE